MGKEFQIQIPQDIVRGNLIDDRAFVVLAKLIQAYYSQARSERSLTFEINRKSFMFYCRLSDNKQLKASLKQLYESQLILNEITEFSRTAELTIALSEKVIPELNKGQMFVQLGSSVLHGTVIDAIKYKGIRILYHLMSYINYNKPNKDHCYASIKRMCSDMGMKESSFKNYIKKLEDLKFIRVKRHDFTQEYYDDKHGIEGALLQRWNNHYFIKYENIKKFAEESKGSITNKPFKIPRVKSS